MSRMFAVFFTLITPLVATGTGKALANPCLSSAAAAAERYAVPLEILEALARVETGRGTDRAPWAWSLNHNGESIYAPSRVEAEQLVRSWLAHGDTSFDLGCFQINMRWHGAAFADPLDLMDPAVNANYAAKYLRDLYQETGSWEQSIGYYHSRTPDLARLYRGRVMAYVNGPIADDRQNVPALASGPSGRPSQTLGSLFPVHAKRVLN